MAPDLGGRQGPAVSQVEPLAPCFEKAKERTGNGLRVVLERRAKSVSQTRQPTDEDPRSEKIADEGVAARQYDRDRAFGVADRAYHLAGHAVAIERKVLLVEDDVGPEGIVRAERDPGLVEEASGPACATDTRRSPATVGRSAAIMKPSVPIANVPSASQ
jgi:hypothetical protein